MSHHPSLAAPAFPGDDGSVDAALAAALEAYAADEQLAPVLATLDKARLIVPVVALVGETPSGGDTDADMAAVFMTGADGRQALLAFSCLATMQHWDAQARPVSVYSRQAAQAAVAEGASALLLDIAGPTMVVIESGDLDHLAQGHRIVDSSAGPLWLT